MLARNPAELVTPPRIEEREFQSWDVDQVARFLLVVESDHNAALWQLAILVGLRRGELLGLKWEDRDLDRGTLSVARTYSRTATSGWGIGPPKTRSSRRIVAPPPPVVEALRRHRTRQLE